ncbi:MAG TPA: hypothetical protein VG759_26875 [Candidatus Angelobacter sp.]|nr:hypothetical protein [Candidatus Angelobacter sp.]
MKTLHLGSNSISILMRFMLVFSSLTAVLAFAQTPTPTPILNSASAPSPSPTPTPAVSTTGSASGQKSDSAAGNTVVAGNTAIEYELCPNSNSPISRAQPADRARVMGAVRADGDQTLDVDVVLKSKDNPNSYMQKVDSCKQPGYFFYVLDVPPGSYDLSLSSLKYARDGVPGVTLTKNQVWQRDFSLRQEASVRGWYLIPLPILFLVSIWVIRWNNIAKPSRLDLDAKLNDLKVRLQNTQWRDELGAAQTTLHKANGWDWLFWTRGQEIAGWKIVHQAELFALQTCAPEQVDARLLTAQQQLLESDKSSAKALAARVNAALNSTPPPSDPAKKCLLIEAMRYIWDTTDTDFSAFTSWQNKAFWLTLVGIILVMTIAAMERHYSLFVAGAVGGFLSRLMRQLKRADVPTDYGASWSTLFLSPVAGAMCGWFGVTLIMLLAAFGVLGGPLTAIHWDEGNVAPVIAAAFLLGFSERFFDKVVSKLEENIDKKEEAKKANSGTIPLTPTAPNPLPGGVGTR